MFTRIFKYSLKNIFRNTFLSISSVLVLTLLMFFINILLVIHNISFKLIEGVNEKLTISLYLQDGYDKNSVEVIGLIESIKGIGGGIGIFYKDKDDVLEEVRRKDPELVNIIERHNPLPETIELSNISIKDYEAVNYIIQSKLYLLSEDLKKEKGGDEGASKKGHFSDYNMQYKKITNVITVLSTLQVVLYIIVGIFVFSIGIIIYSIIGNFIYYYRDEIYITRLVGGSKFFIYGPFSFQGMIYSSVSFALSLIIFLLIIKNTNFILGGEYSSSFLIGNTIGIFLLEFIVFVFIGGLSGLISSRKYLT